MRSRKAIINIVISLILQFVSIICGFIIPKQIITTYGSSVNGIIASITQFLSYISLLQFGIGPVIRAALYSPIVKKDKKEIENILYSSQRFFKTIAYIFICYIIILIFVFPVLDLLPMNISS